MTGKTRLLSVCGQLYIMLQIIYVWYISRSSNLIPIGVVSWHSWHSWPCPRQWQVVREQGSVVVRFNNAKPVAKEVPLRHIHQAWHMP